MSHDIHRRLHHLSRPRRSRDHRTRLHGRTPRRLRQLGGPIISLYTWKGDLETAEEIPLHVKTRATLFDKLSARVKSLHPYETPCIIATELVAVEADYAAWLEAETVA